MPGGPGIRVDSHAYNGYFVPPHYDSLIGKIIAYGDTREQAIARMRIALSEMVVEGIKTNIPLHQELLHDAAFLRGGTSIHYLEEKLAKLLARQGASGGERPGREAERKSSRHCITRHLTRLSHSDMPWLSAVTVVERRSPSRFRTR